MRSDEVPGSAAPLLMVHPDDMDLPWIKAEAAKRGVDVVGSVNVPRGSAFLADGSLRSLPNLRGDGPDA